MKYRYLFFDVANTLLGKPDLAQGISAVLAKHARSVPASLVRERHKLLCEITKFPDKTSREFYRGFNADLLYTLGIPPTPELVEEIYQFCADVPWVRFDDTNVLEQLDLPLGIISNWDHSLKETIVKHFGRLFFQVTGSAEAGVAKPDPSLFTSAVRDLPCDPAQIVYVGDSIKLDIEPASRAGMEPVLVDRDNIYPAFPGRRISTLADLLSML